MAILSNQRLSLTKRPMKSSAKLQGWMTLAVRDSSAVHGDKTCGNQNRGTGTSQCSPWPWGWVQKTYDTMVYIYIYVLKYGYIHIPWTFISSKFSSHVQIFFAMLNPAIRFFLRCVLQFPSLRVRTSHWSPSWKILPIHSQFNEVVLYPVGVKSSATSLGCPIPWEQNTITWATVNF